MTLLAVLMAGAAVGEALLFREPAPVPGVRSLTFKERVEVRIDAAQTVRVTCPDAAAVGWVRRHLQAWFGFSPRVEAVSAEPTVPADEGYRLRADANGVSIEAKTLAGVRYALYTLRQIAERDSSGETVAYYRLPELTIEDAPAMRFRGVHFCWFPEQSAAAIERQIRVAAMLKFNYVVLESWGVFRSARHPWFGWKDGPMTRAALDRLRAAADDLGVTLIPQLNVWGHAAAARSTSGKHAALDVSPERQSLFEPGGGEGVSQGACWNWCLSNPAARQVVRDLVEEMHEAFGRPPFFHIGCDEAEKPTCANCRATPYARLVADHIAAIAGMLKARGARTMMWHDMLLLRGDPRWKGFYANGGEETSRLPTLLPKDIVVCDWYYGGVPESKDYPTLAYFSSECRFDTLTCPWNNLDGIRAQTRYAGEHGLFGTLCTTWHHFGGMRMAHIMLRSACGAWGGNEKGSGAGAYAVLYRQAGWDMGDAAGGYRDSGWTDAQVTREIIPD